MSDEKRKEDDSLHPSPAIMVTLKIKDVVFDKDVLLAVVKGNNNYSLAGLVLGGLGLLAGCVLSVCGIVGNTNMLVKMLGAGEIHVNDATPGVVMAIISALIIYFTRPKITIEGVHKETSRRR